MESGGGEPQRQSAVRTIQMTLVTRKTSEKIANKLVALTLVVYWRSCSGGSSASPSRRRPAVVNKPIVILSDDVKQERARTFVGSIVDGTAIVIIRDLQGGSSIILLCAASSTHRPMKLDEGESKRQQRQHYGVE